MKDRKTYLRLKAMTHVGENGCWIWDGGISKTIGRGRVTVHGVRQLAHRAMYEAVNGIPKDLYVCHHCDNLLCVNPQHLFAGTQHDNMQDMLRKGRLTPEVREAFREHMRRRWQSWREFNAQQAGAPPDWKHCPRCDQWKPPSGFHKSSSTRDGLRCYCKPCHLHAGF